MTKIEYFEDIRCWQEARELVVDVFKTFIDCRDYSFRDQIKRAALSVMNNIAEGYERQTNKEFRNFLYIAKGSCGEVRSMLYIAVDLNYISIKDFDKIKDRTIQISKMLSSFIKTL